MINSSELIDITCVDSQGGVQSEYDQVFQYEHTGANIIDIQELLKGASEDKVPIWTLNISGESFELSKPIMLFPSIEKGIHIVENETLNICAGGSSLSEAVKDAKEDIVHFIEHYSSISEDDLHDKAKEIRAHYLDISDNLCQR